MLDDAVRAVAELAASQHGALSRSQAADINFDSRRVATALRHGWLAEPYPGVLVTVGSCDTWRRRLVVATMAAGGHAVASHRSAARLHRLDGFDECDIIEVSVSRQHRWRHSGAVAHHITPLDSIDLLAIDGVPTTGLARTLADLGSVVDDPLVVRRAVTDARRRGTSLTWLWRTAQRLHRPGQRGTGILRRLLAAIPHEGRVPDSWLEELLRLCVDDPDIPAVIPQYPIRDRRGQVVAHADLGIPAVRLGLEGHSRRFHFGPEAEPLDEQRDIRAASCGWELLYLGWFAAQSPSEVLEIVKDVVAARTLAA